MAERKLSTAELILFAATRTAFGAGIGLLLSRRLNNDERKAAGITLAVLGGVFSIPLAISVLGKRGEEEIRRAA
jgi:hypothetical protein